MSTSHTHATQRRLRAVCASARRLAAPSVRVWLTTGGLLGAALAFPQAALAHGIVGRADLPIPVWLFSWAAAVVLVVSFVALATLWTAPQLQQVRLRRVLAFPALVPWVLSLIGVGFFVLVLYSGFAGAQVASANFSVTFIYVAFWVGLPLASVLFGDVFRALSPWRSCARALAWLYRLLARRSPRAPFAYPSWLGVWPAVAWLVGFGWLELVYAYRDVPSTLAALSLGYFLVMLAGMTAFGIEEFGTRADGFSVYFSLLARLSAVEFRGGELYRRRPLSAITSLPIQAGTVTLICTVIGTTTFDGASNGGYWKELYPHISSIFGDLGLGVTPATELAYTLGLLACIGLVAGVFHIGVLGMRGVSDLYTSTELTRKFAHTLVPIGFGYLVAHYFSLVIWQGQALGYLISDPLGNGANIIGTSGWQINYKIISFAAIWYVQVAALLAGHVGGLALAHDRALAIYEDPVEAVRSQYWMLGVMVAFTSFGLWLLSAVGT